MSDDDEPVSSADQDAWVAIARALRFQIERQIPTAGAMSPNDLKTFIDAVREVQWLHERSLEFDANVARENARQVYD
jgi:hypothetical protein